MKSAELTAGAAAWPAEGQSPHAHRTKHDREQQDYLATIGSKPKTGGLAIEGGGRLNGPTINPANVASAARQWHGRRPQIAVIDNLLTDEALAELRRFCWGSTVWRTNFQGGYLGALPEHGFACPLLAQIAEELRTTFADICGNHALKYLWAFKYDSRLSGITIHADFAAVNVNFWITPDEANLDPESGGLVVWDVAAPLDWDYEIQWRPGSHTGFPQAQRCQTGDHSLSRQSGSDFQFRSVSRNRHDPFKEGYLNRRINVTLLYGDRVGH